MIKAVLAEIGSCYPLGATVDDDGVNFAIFSANAEQVDVCLFDEDGVKESSRYRLPEQTDGVWHGRIDGLRAGARYGFRVYGPYEPRLGHRFNHHKLLLDPYARAFSGAFIQSDLLCGYVIGSVNEDLSFDTRDSASVVPKCVVVDQRRGSPPRKISLKVPWHDTVIYEAHVRGLTMRHDAVEAERRGRFLGLVQDDVIAHIRSLGVTSVELLPVQTPFDERFLYQKGLTNFWGYNTIGFFAPNARFAIHDPIEEFKLMVERFHDAGLEVLLDVVYNHTAEGNELGPTLSFRGIDNASYYRLQEQDSRYYVNDTGCGNTLNSQHPAVVRMIMDSLRYFAKDLGVDGFRFDLATVLGRDDHGFNAASPLMQSIRQDPVLSMCKLIAEPWDIGPGGYQLGHFGSGWAEWNDKFRDSVRRFWRGDAGVAPDLARRMHGSSDLFEHDGRKPWAGVNYVTSHDGFTLTDVVSYLDRHNEANGERNNDGHTANYSHNYGVEGPTTDDSVQMARDRQRRNLIATVLLSQGTPMLLAGDELGHTQGGNNNAYCQDNETSWIDWRGFEREIEFLNFVKTLIEARKRFINLRWQRYLHPASTVDSGAMPAIAWYGKDGCQLVDSDWQDPELRSFALLINARASLPIERELGFQDPAAVLVVLNASRRAVSFRLPVFDSNLGGSHPRWTCEISTADTMPTIAKGSTLIEPLSTNLMYDGSNRIEDVE